MDTMIHVGASKETVTEAKTAIIEILGSGASDQILLKALDVFTSVCEVKHTTIKDCSFENATGATVRFDTGDKIGQ